MTEETISFDLYHPQPLFIVISGPTAVGKDAVIKLMFEHKFPLHFVITATTRPKREVEVEGVDYFFVGEERFKEMIDQNELIEYSWVYNAYKGIPRKQVEQALASGVDVIMRVDVQGAQKIRQIYPECVQIFLIPKSEKELRERIRFRKSETEEESEMRLATAREELKQIPKFDYIVVNEDSHLEKTVNTIWSIIEAEHHRVNPRKIVV
ncbi:MAG TPA: guanylate kinase [Anaerolineaceae bacterium]|nr:guanylate kinase [Anaerolineaceae bacterium]